MGVIYVDRYDGDEIVCWDDLRDRNRSESIPLYLENMVSKVASNFFIVVVQTSLVVKMILSDVVRGDD